jgi:hypothetical protein
LKVAGRVALSARRWSLPLQDGPGDLGLGVYDLNYLSMTISLPP